MPAERECCCQRVTSLVERLVERERELTQKIETLAASTPEVREAGELAKKEKANQLWWDEVFRTARFALAVMAGSVLVACQGEKLANLLRPTPADLGARVAALFAAPDAQRRDNVAALRRCVETLQAVLPASAPVGKEAEAALKPPVLSDARRDELRQYCKVLLA